MLIETHAPGQSTATVFVPDTLATMNQSGMSYDALHGIAEGKESLAASLDAALLQKAWMELVRDLFLAPTIAVQIDTPLGRKSVSGARGCSVLFR